jgi:type II secretory pathway predicted ATPase ExeA
MYRSFFGLKELPFKISPDLSYFYKQASREEMVEALLYSILRGDGIVKVVGEVGIGKTMMLRMLVEKLPKHYQNIYISSPNLSPIDFLKFICSELQISYDSTDTKHDLVKRLQARLIETYAQGKRVVMLVDEAQSMTLDALEEVRLLGNLETETDKLLQMVLFGQPELDTTLHDVRVKPLKDRIAAELTLPPLNANEVLMYLNYRMRVAGRLDQDVFTSQIAKQVWKISGGFPRAINLLADKLLMAAFSDGDIQVKKKHLGTLGYSSTSNKGTGMWPKYAVVFGGLLVSLSVMAFVWQKEQGMVVVPKNASQMPVTSKMLSIKELSEKTDTNAKTIKELYRLNMSAFQYLQQLPNSGELLLLSRDHIHGFQSVYKEVMSKMPQGQQSKVYVLLNLDLSKNHFETLTFFDISNLSQEAVKTLQEQFSKKMPQLASRVLTVQQLKAAL